MHSSLILRNTKNEEKTIIIRDSTNEENDKETTVKLSDTVRDLKRKIEKLFNLNLGRLDKINLRMMNKGYRVSSLLMADDTTLFDNHIQSYSIITFMVLENVGGKIFLIK